jgi:hypothetical protein
VNDVELSENDVLAGLMVSVAEPEPLKLPFAVAETV